MTLQSEDMGKLVAGRSVLLDRHWGLLRFDRYDDSERRAFTTGIADGGVRLLVPSEMELIGTITEDGWIEAPEGGWKYPPPFFGLECDLRVQKGGDARRWKDIIAFRPAHSEAQPESDGGGDVMSNIRIRLRDQIARAEADWNSTVSIRLRDAKTIMSVLHPTPEGQTEGALKPFDVTGIPAWSDDEKVWLSCDGQDLGFIKLGEFRRLAALASKGV